MITVDISKGEALLYMEMIRRNSQKLLAQIGDKLEQSVTEQEMMQAARHNYIANLENENKALRTMMNAEVSDQPEVKPAKKKGRTAKPKAPWGYKKDGTPKKRPGRAPGAF
jgi:DNA-binding protein H-NS